MKPPSELVLPTVGSNLISRVNGRTYTVLRTYEHEGLQYCDVRSPNSHRSFTYAFDREFWLFFKEDEPYEDGVNNWV